MIRIEVVFFLYNIFELDVVFLIGFLGIAIVFDDDFFYWILKRKVWVVSNYLLFLKIVKILRILFLVILN